MKTLILFTMLVVFTGCVSEKNNQKVYRRKIEFYQPEKLKVLYSMPEEEKLPEKYRKINFLDTEIAEISLNTHRLFKINEETKKWLAVAQQELKKAQALLAERKAKMTEQEKQYQLIKEMKNELKEFNVRIEKIKLKKNKVQAP